MQVQEVDVIRLQLLKRIANRQMQTFLVIAAKVQRLLFTQLIRLVARGELGGDDHLVAVVMLLHPLADPLLAFFALV